MSRAPHIRRARVAQEARISALSTCGGIVLVVLTVGRVTVRLDSFVGSQWSLLHASRATTLPQKQVTVRQSRTVALAAGRLGLSRRRTCSGAMAVRGRSQLTVLQQQAIGIPNEQATPVGMQCVAPAF